MLPRTIFLGLTSLAVVKPARLHFASCPNFQPRAHAGLTGLTTLAAVSLLLERGPLPFFTVKKRPDSLFHETSSIKFFMETAYVA